MLGYDERRAASESIVGCAVAMDLQVADNAAGRWEAIARDLSRVKVAWEQMSPDTSGPINELADDASWNAAYWRGRGRGLDDREAARETRSLLGSSSGRYINYDADEVSQ